MRFTIGLRLSRTEGALMRLVGLVRRRGYEITDLEAHLTADGSEQQVSLTLESDRAAESLARHVENLVEVQSVVVEVVTQAALRAAAE